MFLGLFCLRSVIAALVCSYLSTVKQVYKRQLKTTKRNGKWQLNEGKNGAFSNTFDLHFAIIGIENKFLCSF